MKTQEKLNMTMLCDFYELTMGNGYFQTGYKDRIVYFDVFFRKVPDGGGFAITAGLEQLIDYIENLHFSEEDIAYLRGRGIFCEEFLAYLRDFRFTGDIYAIPEGTPVFPKEPLVVVRAPAIEAQLIETFTLLTINHQSLIATKANRIQRAARGRTVLEFGSRRAQGADAAIVGARAAYIGGVAGTACTLSDEVYSVPAGGTMAHAWVQMFPSELEAFKTYCRLYPTNACGGGDGGEARRRGGRHRAGHPDPVRCGTGGKGGGNEARRHRRAHHPVPAGDRQRRSHRLQAQSGRVEVRAELQRRQIRRTIKKGGLRPPFFGIDACGGTEKAGGGHPRWVSSSCDKKSIHPEGWMLFCCIL